MNNLLVSEGCKLLDLLGCLLRNLLKERIRIRIILLMNSWWRVSICRSIFGAEKPIWIWKRIIFNLSGVRRISIILLLRKENVLVWRYERVLWYRLIKALTFSFVILFLLLVWSTSNCILIFLKRLRFTVKIIKILNFWSFITHS